MKRVFAVTFALGLMLTACLPALPGQTEVNQATPSLSSDKQAATEAPTQTTEPLPTSTLVPTKTFTPIPSLTPPSASETPIATAIIGTPATSTSQTPSATTTLPGLSIDKLPAGTIYVRIRIENKSRTQMDISLQCTTRQGLFTVLEYTNVRSIFVDAPQGNCVYVVYVGGRQLIGNFSLSADRKLTITVYKDRVAIH